MTETVPGQSTIFDALGTPEPASTRARRQRGSAWHRDALDRIAALAGTGTTFQAFDLAAAGIPEPEHPRQWGTLLSAASRMGVVRPVGQSASARPGNAHTVTLWTGV